MYHAVPRVALTVGLLAIACAEHEPADRPTYVAGQRTVTVNDETKTLRISGIVRSYDVTGNNTVTSAQVADARIEIHGEGANTRQVTKGPLGQMFDTLIWFAWPF